MGLSKITSAQELRSLHWIQFVYFFRFLFFHPPPKSLASYPVESPSWSAQLWIPPVISNSLKMRPGLGMASTATPQGAEPQAHAQANQMHGGSCSSYHIWIQIKHCVARLTCAAGFDFPADAPRDWVTQPRRVGKLMLCGANFDMRQRTGRSQQINSFPTLEELFQDRVFPRSLPRNEPIGQSTRVFYWDQLP